MAPTTTPDAIDGRGRTMIAYLRSGRGLVPVVLTGEERDGLVEVRLPSGETAFVGAYALSECAGGRCEIRR